MSIDVKLPDLGDGIKSGDILKVLVRAGDAITKDQPIVEIETDKATVEVPSPCAGQVEKVLVAVGQTVPVGGSLLTVAANPATNPSNVVASPPAAASPAAVAKGTASASPAPPSAPATRGAGAAASPAASAPPAPAPPAPAPTTPATTATARPAPATPAARTTAAAAHAVTPAVTSNAPDASVSVGDVAAAPAGPAIRRLAREVGVDLTQVVGSGPRGRITREDVLEVVRSTHKAANGLAPVAPPAGRGVARALPGTPSQDTWGLVHHEPLTKIRQTIAAKMFESWSTVPRVTNFDDADITELDKVRKSSQSDYAAAGIKLTTLPFVVKAVSMALHQHPLLNASIDLENNRIVYKNYVNLGIAVDTDRGLVVPVMRNTDRLAISEIAREVAQVTEKVRSGSFAVDDLRGGSFTISNLGAIGGTYSTPIVNVPEVAILLVGRARKMPVVRDDQVVIRLMMPLSLSYDHRLVDGAAAARFLNDVIGYLQAPSRLLLAI